MRFFQKTTRYTFTALPKDGPSIEAEIRGTSAEHRRAVRTARSRPIVEALHAWLQQQVPGLPVGLVLCLDPQWPVFAR
jgi:hypothetical protein